ncbi:Peptidyl-arginine deiminase Porphyromonas-type [Penicillium robsamsonii]|uniref:Peptidyl-arginine deiminase Porphyromonas-type n=1 Tax=Penicillium robsamsonii TaxID=1792511 RepID=UPI002547C464|nr:Peptidyl-arginine deiminase Porphyromonas-type [Penicillium robsamsonii]KAJ5835453.1 Peptidyl-arginine deiminase Porphyromonas-type [Penicillium robsamsonii]
MALSSVKASIFFLPHETARHAATILGFPSQASIASAYYESACVDFDHIRDRKMYIRQSQWLAKLSQDTRARSRISLAFHSPRTTSRFAM